MADQKTPELVTPIDPYKHINVVLNPDGSLARNIYDQFPNIPPSNDPNSTISFDIPLNPSKKTWMRVFQPPNLSSTHKLPIIVYFHGGGFALYNPSTNLFHEFCVKMASVLPAIIISVDYQLSPEHKLPSAYDDAIEALAWVKTQALSPEFEFCEFVDFGKCYVMGTSSGSNIVYHAGLKALGMDLGPVKIKGFILNLPFFGGVQRTESELRFQSNMIIPLTVCDLMWEFCLPSGADRDHEYCNPMIGSTNKDEIKRMPRCYVSAYGRDPLLDRQMEFIKMLEEHGVSVVKYFAEDGFHGCELIFPDKAQALLVDIQAFINSS